MQCSKCCGYVWKTIKHSKISWGQKTTTGPIINIMEWIFLFRHNQEENLPGVRAGNSDRNTDGRNCLFLFPCVFVNICLWCVFCVLSVLLISDLHVCFVVLCKWPFKSFRFLISPSLLSPPRPPQLHPHPRTHPPSVICPPLPPPPPTPHTHTFSYLLLCHRCFSFLQW